MTVKTILTRSKKSGTDIPVHIGWSSNSKTGHMPVSTTGSDSCPTTCKHMQIGTCYAKFSFLGIHWKKVDSGERDMGWNSVLSFISNLPTGQIHRWNQAGDLPGYHNKIDSRKFLQLIDANRGKHGFTYTHKPLTPKNLDLIHYANSNGFTVNYSCDTVPDALILRQKFQILGYNIPIVVTVTTDYDEYDPNIKLCPNQITDVTCVKCQWCADSTRKFIIAFKAHGSKKGCWE